MGPIVQNIDNVNEFEEGVLTFRVLCNYSYNMGIPYSFMEYDIYQQRVYMFDKNKDFLFNSSMFTGVRSDIIFPYTICPDDVYFFVITYRWINCKNHIEKPEDLNICVFTKKEG